MVDMIRYYITVLKGMPVLAPGILISHDSTGVTKGGKEGKKKRTRTKTFVWKLENEDKKEKLKKLSPKVWSLIFFNWKKTIYKIA